jgi:CDP-paratose 2-epimerase
MPLRLPAGSGNVTSLLELVDFIEKKRHDKLPYSFGPWRPGDQKVFASDIRRAQKEVGWSPKVSWQRV